MAYAKGTTVSIEKSQLEIRELLRRNGADEFAQYEGKNVAKLSFRLAEKFHVLFEVPLPNREDFATYTQQGRIWRRVEHQIDKAFHDECKRRWRSLLLCIKAKLEAAETGISTVEKEFLPFIVMGDGRTFAEHVIPRLTAQNGKAYLPALPAPVADDDDVIDV